VDLRIDKLSQVDDLKAHIKTLDQQLEQARVEAQEAKREQESSVVHVSNERTYARLIPNIVVIGSCVW
jgi:outer membrane murein-binding lipoprotein Lpp